MTAVIQKLQTKINTSQDIIEKQQNIIDQLQEQLSAKIIKIKESKSFDKTHNKL